jgi:iron complex transport system permease protein
MKFVPMINSDSPIRKIVFNFLLVLVPIVLSVAALSIGRYRIGTQDVLRVLISPVFPDAAVNITEIAKQLILRVRLPRVLAALLIGASFGTTGTAFQAIFKNPLVDSNILGVTSGAGFGAALALLLLFNNWQVQGLAFVFGLVAVLLSFLGSRLYKTAPILVLTLMGILVGTLFSSLTSLLKYIADPLDTLPAITFWLLGSLASVTWARIILLAIITLLGVIFFILMRWQLNILSLGDKEAISLGVNPVKMKLFIIVVATLMTASAVSTSGVIGWVGLVIPHLGRLLVGPNHRRLLPISISLGGSFMIILDTVARTLLPGEIPLGVLTGILGVPLLILLLRRSRTGG